MTRPPPARRRPGSRRAGTPAAWVPLEPVPLRHPAHLLALTVVIAAVLISTCSRIYDTDLWQHLLVGKVIWTQHRVPTLQLWSWPTYGSVDVTSSYSWAFRALVWPLWSGFGVLGLYLLRWAASLAIFVIAWRTARRLGARDIPALAVFLIAALVFRQRSQVRPELVAAVLLAACQWILETRRTGGPDRSVLLIPLLWLWANVHISYVLGYLMAGAYLVGDLRGGRAGGATPAATRRLALSLLASIPLLFLNPFGWRAVVQPFQFILFQRQETILATIAELRPPVWKENLRNGLPLLLAGWPLLMIVRARRRGLDLVELLLCLAFTGLALRAWRFVGPHAVVAAPFLARDLEQALGAVRWPAWARGAWGRAAVFLVPGLALGALEWSRPGLPLGIRVDPRAYPAAACDYIASHDVRGRGFTQFEFGGYLLWRFWPDRTRLPFMDIHQSGTHEIRAAYPLAFADPGSWAALDRQWRFDYVLLNRILMPGEVLPDVLDADSTTWARVFLDDRAALWVRRSSPGFAQVAADEYRLVPAGTARLPELQARWSSDSALADRSAAELERMAAASPQSVAALNLLARVEFSRGRLDSARAALERAVAPGQERAPGAHGMLALIALLQNRPADAVTEARRELAESPRRRGMHALLARAYAQLGDRARARAAWRSERAIDPTNPEAADSLAVLEGRGP